MDYSNLSENDMAFANEFSSFVNGKMDNASQTGHELANDHRYLVNQKFKVVMAFIEQLADNYKKGFYDDRNKWACLTAYFIIEDLREKELYYSSLNF